MYGKEHQEIVFTGDNYLLLFAYVDQLVVWNDYLGLKVEINENFCNPWREDKTPKCYLDYHEGRLLLYDWADSRFNFEDIIGLVCRVNKFNFNKAIDHISSLYVSGSSFNPEIYNQIKPFEFQIGFEPKKWTINDKNYWSPYGITKSQLESDGVHSVDKYYHNNRARPDKIVCKQPNDVCYAYLVKDKVKIYRPNAILKFDKWLSNIGNILLGLNSTSYTDNYIIVTKSHKDWRILINVGFTACYIQSETHLINNETLGSLISRYKRIYILFDNDTPGIINAKRLSDYINGLYSNSTSYFFLSGATDPAEVYLILGKKNLMSQLHLNIKEQNEAKDLPNIIHESWNTIFTGLLNLEGIRKVKSLLNQHNHCPTNNFDIFRVFSMPLDKVKVVILGQDPYPNPIHANGLAFGTKSDIKPASLKIIEQELQDNNDCVEPYYSIVDLSLQSWHDQGVLLLNTALTVQKNASGSHRDYWKPFMLNLLIRLIKSRNNLIFLVWGSIASKLINEIRQGTDDSLNHHYLFAAHPAAEARNSGTSFNCCRHFDKVNELLDTPINW